MKKILEKILDIGLNFDSFQNYINYKYNVKDYVIINDGRYCLNPMIVTTKDLDTYNIEGIRPTDIVLDVGACIGAISIPMSKIAAHVYSVEPLWIQGLKQNIKLNNIKNITVFDGALGTKTLKLSFNGKSKTYQCKRLRHFIKLCGGHVDVVKLDCEGGEWSIDEKELDGIRIIEAEVHMFKGMPHHTVFGKLLTNADFSFTVDHINTEMVLYHAVRK